MTQPTLGVILNGATGRMGYRQHLVRSVLAIREQGGVELPDGRRVQAVNLCFEARPLGNEAPSTPHETLATGWFAPDALPDPLVPIHEIRIRDALDGDRAARIR